MHGKTLNTIRELFNATTLLPNLRPPDKIDYLKKHFFFLFLNQNTELPVGKAWFCYTYIGNLKQEQLSQNELS